jgi:hypothetical protein
MSGHSHVPLWWWWHPAAEGEVSILSSAPPSLPLLHDVLHHYESPSYSGARSTADASRIIARATSDATPAIAAVCNTGDGANVDRRRCGQAATGNGVGHPLTALLPAFMLASPVISLTSRMFASPFPTPSWTNTDLLPPAQAPQHGKPWESSELATRAAASTGASVSGLEKAQPRVEIAGNCSGRQLIACITVKFSRQHSPSSSIISLGDNAQLPLLSELPVAVSPAIAAVDEIAPPASPLAPQLWLTPAPPSPPTQASLILSGDILLSNKIPQSPTHAPDRFVSLSMTDSAPSVHHREQTLTHRTRNTVGFKTTIRSLQAAPAGYSTTPATAQQTAPAGGTDIRRRPPSQRRERQNIVSPSTAKLVGSSRARQLVSLAQVRSPPLLSADELAPSPVTHLAAHRKHPNGASQEI